MFRAYLLVWCAAYLVFWRYPTVAPRPVEVVGEGFGAWGLRFLYGADPPRNCFPSLHVAVSFVSALAVGLVNREVGRWAIGSATLVALSTLFTKQHYVVDVLAGVAMALLAGRLLLRRPQAAPASPETADVALPLALALLGAIALLLVVMFGAYRWLG
jgi:membrane-associated phospholipid phosphatase